MESACIFNKGAPAACSCITVLFGARLRLARIYIYGVHTVFLAGISPNIRSCMVYLYGYDQPYACCVFETVSTCPAGRKRLAS